MADSTRHARTRTERLRPEAVTHIENALNHRWAEQNPTRRLTQWARAELLGLSIPTADKLLRGEPVDRNTLKDALSKVGIPWDESLVVVETTVTPAKPDPPRKGYLRFVAALASVAISLIAAFHFFASQHSIPEWQSKTESLIAQAEVEYNQMEYVKARETARTARAMAEEHRSFELMSLALFMEGKVESVTATPESARRLYLQALELRSLFGDEHAYPPIYERLADVEVKLGNFQQAEGALLQAREGFRKEGHAMGVAEAERGLGTVAHHIGEYKKALRFYDQSLGSVPDTERADFEADIIGLRAMTLSAQGHHEKARKDLLEVLYYWKAKGHVRWVASTEFKLGQVALADSNEKLAQTHLSHALAGYQAVGDQTGVKLVANFQSASNRSGT